MTISVLRAGAGCLFLPAQPGDPYCYCEVGIDT